MQHFRSFICLLWVSSTVVSLVITPAVKDVDFFHFRDAEKRVRRALIIRCCGSVTCQGVNKTAYAIEQQQRRNNRKRIVYLGTVRPVVLATPAPLQFHFVIPAVQVTTTAPVRQIQFAIPVTYVTSPPIRPIQFVFPIYAPTTRSPYVSSGFFFLDLLSQLFIVQTVHVSSAVTSPLGKTTQKVGNKITTKPTNNPGGATTKAVTATTATSNAGEETTTQAAEVTSAAGTQTTAKEVTTKAAEETTEAVKEEETTTTAPDEGGGDVVPEERRLFLNSAVQKISRRGKLSVKRSTNFASTHLDHDTVNQNIKIQKQAHVSELKKSPNLNSPVIRLFKNLTVKSGIKVMQNISVSKTTKSVQSNTNLSLNRTYVPSRLLNSELVNSNKNNISVNKTSKGKHQPGVADKPYSSSSNVNSKATTKLANSRLVNKVNITMVTRTFSTTQRSVNSKINNKNESRNYLISNAYNQQKNSVTNIKVIPTKNPSNLPLKSSTLSKTASSQKPFVLYKTRINTTKPNHKNVNQNSSLTKSLKITEKIISTSKKSVFNVTKPVGKVTQTTKIMNTYAVTNVTKSASGDSQTTKTMNITVKNDRLSTVPETNTTKNIVSKNIDLSEKENTTYLPEISLENNKTLYLDSEKMLPLHLDDISKNLTKSQINSSILKKNEAEDEEEDSGNELEEKTSQHNNLTLPTTLKTNLEKITTSQSHIDEDAEDQNDEELERQLPSTMSITQPTTTRPVKQTTESEEDEEEENPKLTNVTLILTNKTVDMKVDLQIKNSSLTLILTNKTTDMKGELQIKNSSPTLILINKTIDMKEELQIKNSSPSVVTTQKVTSSSSDEGDEDEPEVEVTTSTSTITTRTSVRLTRKQVTLAITTRTVKSTATTAELDLEE